MRISRINKEIPIKELIIDPKAGEANTSTEKKKDAIYVKKTDFSIESLRMIKEYYEHHNFSPPDYTNVKITSKTLFEIGRCSKYHSLNQINFRFNRDLD